jgi:hypothetical protein
MPKFTPGQSGNPKGRKPGLTDKRHALKALLDPHADALVGKAVSLALEGDTAALRLCLERLMPPLRPKDEPVTLEQMDGTLAQQGQAILAAMGQGTLAPDQAARLLQALAAQARITEVDDLARRVAALEVHLVEKS